MSTNLLITGGRAPAALELARIFGQAGFQVIAAESIRYPLTKSSRYVNKSYRVPPPRQSPEPFIDSLLSIINKEKVSLLIPTCEEIYTLSRYKDRFANSCKVLVDSIDQLKTLHDKWLFIESAKQHGLPVPKTWRVESHNELKNFPCDVVLKPVYSRFASQIYILRKDEKETPPIPISQERPFVAQEHLSGRSFCTYSIAHQGHLTAHAVYPVTWRAGKGACITFQSVDEPRILEWVKSYVKSIRFTGQIAFDFIEGNDGIPYPIECNPRATSGLHLFDESIIPAFLDSNSSLIIPKGSAKRMIGLAMIAYGKFSLDWFKTFIKSKDVIFSCRDIKPFFYQFATYWHLAQIALKQNISILEASTHDIEWNGES